MMVQVRDNLSIETLVSGERGLGWSLELFELNEPVAAHVHEGVRQILVMLEGKMHAMCGGSWQVLSCGELCNVPPGVSHALEPQGAVRFLSIDLSQGSGRLEGGLDCGEYVVHELADEAGWSAALLEIEDSPRHFHRVEREHFVVVEGVLDIEIGGERRCLRTGESVRILPGQRHHLKSGNEEPVSVLCFNFPAFNPADMIVEE